MSEPQQIKETYIHRRESITTSPSSQPINNTTYKTQIIIHQKPIQLIDDKQNNCSKCQNKINENEIEFNNRFYHQNCFKCSNCQRNLNDLKNDRFKLNNHGEPICSNCELLQAQICFICNKPIISSETITFDQNKYHSFCFYCTKCQKSLIDQTNLRIFNSKVFCFQCYNQDFAPKCEQCLKPISIGKSIIFNEKKYHEDCFRCNKCYEIINDINVSVLNSKPYCSQCYQIYFAPKCEQCLKPILTGKSITFNEKEYHQDCFSCKKCNRIINNIDGLIFNSKPYCSQCYQIYFAPKCEQCLKPILSEKSRIFNEKEYHEDCFRCNKCDKTINDINVSIFNSKHYCSQCYQIYFAPQCEQCLKPILSKKSRIFNEKNYHEDCFRCNKCNEIINDINISIFNSKPYCSQCYQIYLAPKCDKCLKPILNEKFTIFNENKYHLDCFCCNQCNKIINDINISVFNSKPYCSQCYQIYFSPKCEQCLKPISSEKSRIFNEKNYHMDCFRCNQCNETINDINVSIFNSKPYCSQCYNKYLAPQCDKCFQKILNEKFRIFNEKNYHEDCFRCNYCDQTIFENKFPINNGKVYCIQCFDQHFASKCIQCLKVISTGRSIIYNDNKYHPECFRCFKCNQIIMENKFHTHNSKPCCNQCYYEHFTLICSKCSKPINDKYTEFKKKTFHIQCFNCSKCHRIIESKDYFHNGESGVLCSTCANSLI